MPGLKQHPKPASSRRPAKPILRKVVGEGHDAVIRTEPPQAEANGRNPHYRKPRPRKTMLVAEHEARIAEWRGRHNAAVEAGDSARKALRDANTVVVHAEKAINELRARINALERSAIWAHGVMSAIDAALALNFLRISNVNPDDVTKAMRD